MKKILFLILVLIFVSFMACNDKKVQISGKPYHHVESGFRNPLGSIDFHKGFSFEALWFGLSSPFLGYYNPETPKGHILDQKIALKTFIADKDKDSITWIGHMTTIVRLEGQVIAYDPWFTDSVVLSTFGDRAVPPGIALSQLPQINTVVISHNHYDHLNIETLEQLSNPQKITVVVPLGVSRYFEHINFKKVIELDWHQSTKVNNIKYTALPVVHWSTRMVDRDETLWAAWSIESSSGKKIFLGEGEYGEVYKEIGEEYGPFDVALISTGAYLPRVIMQGNHCIPENCVQIGLDIGAKNLVPIHWGTIALGWDDFFQSGPKFRKEALKKGIIDKNIWLMKIGETRNF